MVNLRISDFSRGRVLLPAVRAAPALFAPGDDLAISTSAIYLLDFSIQAAYSKPKPQTPGKTRHDRVL